MNKGNKMTHELHRPCSYSAFRDEHRGLDEKAALEEFGRRLGLYRQRVAAELGVHTDELHCLGPATIKHELAARAIGQTVESEAEAMLVQ